METKGNFVRYYLFCVSLFFFSITNFAQTKGDTLASKLEKKFIISGGYGRPNFLYILTHTNGNGYSEYSNVIDKGTYFLKGEYLTFKDNVAISIGSSIYYSQFSYSDQTGTNQFPTIIQHNLKNLGIGLRVNAYFVYKKGFHFYIGAGGGAQIPLKSYASAFFVEAVLGTRFMFTKNIGLYIEVGAAKAIAQGGLSFKL